jgi:hypothetical protein
MLNYKLGTMDTLNGYGEMNPVSMYDSELENWLDKCKTEEEKDEVIKEYVSMRLMALCAAILILVLSVLIVGAVIYLFR